MLSGIAIFGGLLTGLFLRSKLFSSIDNLYDDAELWEIPENTNFSRPPSPQSKNKVAPLSTPIHG